ncbi:DUF2283 domain-containing protein [Thermococcus thioreducens]|uniref:Uncharacterized protein YuzE n=1 Tax=Thermococcus thioreducens TaxID=277988 RepID=A0A0Q2MTJ1_9EURY|nr:DUF2283 domain-containing protein [Thermococcus thioreducens]ASJ12348.1 hypothetical protein A3L14_05335 [Thermococcus thioreducens]KQH83079.1 hypothetical protein AMR53_02330 [Thermococcus thioreducens]SEV92398.1 Uncharacterized protein YuzE [Thermococcus thioreducens]
MRIEYSQDADVLVIFLKDDKIVDSIDIEEGIIAHLNERGEIVEIEVLDASKSVDFTELIVRIPSGVIT